MASIKIPNRTALIRWLLVPKNFEEAAAEVMIVNILF